MKCPTCLCRSMDHMGIAEDDEVFWCPRCGTMKDDNRGVATVEVPELLAATANRALAEILEYAKAQRGLADSPGDERRWKHVVGLAYDALGKPSMADVDALRREQ